MALISIVGVSFLVTLKWSLKCSPVNGSKRAPSLVVDMSFDKSNTSGYRAED